MNAMTEMPAPLVFTDNAAEKVKSLIEEEGNAELASNGLRAQALAGEMERGEARRD